MLVVALFFKKITCFIWLYMNFMSTFVPIYRTNLVPLPNKYWNVFISFSSP